MKASPVLILFANLKGNLGDFAILNAMLLDSKRKHPGSPVHILSHGQHEIDEKRFSAFKAEAQCEFVYKGKMPFVRITGWFSILKRLGLSRWLSGKCVKYLEQKYAKHPAFRDLKSYDAFYFTGGEQWSGYSNGITMFAVLSLVSGTGKYVHVYPFSAKGKLLENFHIAQLKTLFANFDEEIAVRDSHSYQTVSQITPRVKLGADCVFSLNLNYALEKSATV